MARIVKKCVIAVILYLCIASSGVSGLPTTSLGRLPRPRAGPRDYGPLGNLLKWLIDRATGHTKDSVAPLSNKIDPPPAQAEIVPEKSQRRKHNYGPLGNAIVRVLELCLGRTDKASAVKASVTNVTKPVLMATGDAGDASQPDDAAKPSAKKPKPNKALQSVRELVKLLGSNFLHDPAFERAAEALKLRDKETGLDAAAGSGEFITAAQRELLLSRAKDCIACSA